MNISTRKWKKIKLDFLRAKIWMLDVFYADHGGVSSIRVV